MDNILGKKRDGENVPNVDDGGIPVECMDASRDWARLGVLFTIESTETWVDLEKLIIETSKIARHDERLLVMTASWLAAHHHLLDAGALVKAMDNIDIETSATLGAILSMAKGGAAGSVSLDQVLAYCAPLVDREPLFFLALEYPMVLNRIKKGALPLFERWGFWHNDSKLKFSAIRPIVWIIKAVPELRIRALLSPGIDARVVTALAHGPLHIGEFSQIIGAGEGETRQAVESLSGRGLIGEDEDGRWEISVAGRTYLDLPKLD